MREMRAIYSINMYFYQTTQNYIKYTGWPVTGNTGEQGLVLHEKLNRKYKITVSRIRLRFRKKSI